MGRDSSFLVLFEDPSITIDDAARILAPYQPRREGAGLEIAVPPGDSTIFVGLSDEPHVLLEAEEIAESVDIAPIAKCRRRFECLVDDLEAALLDYAVLAGIQEDLQRLTKGYVFLSWNGEVLEL